MQAERRSIWIIISLLAIAGLWQLNNYFSTPGGFSLPFPYWIKLIVVLPGICAVISALVYAILHYQYKHLTLWLMTLQMLILLMVSLHKPETNIFILLAWMMLLSVISRSKKKENRQPQADLLDDL